SGEPSEHNQRALRSACRRQFASALEQAPFLNMGVVELAEHALNLLERIQDPFEIRGVVKRRRDVDEIPQLFCGNPHVVKARRRRAVVNGFGALGDPAAQLPGTRRDDPAKTTSDACLTKDWLPQERLPFRQEPQEAFAVQRLPQAAVVLLLPLSQKI